MFQRNYDKIKSVRNLKGKIKMKKRIIISISSVGTSLGFGTLTSVETFIFGEDPMFRKDTKEIMLDVSDDELLRILTSIQKLKSSNSDIDFYKEDENA